MNKSHLKIFAGVFSKQNGAYEQELRENSCLELGPGSGPLQCSTRFEMMLLDSEDVSWDGQLH